MFVKLLLAFSLIPLVELALLIKIGGYIGVWWTILLVAGTGLAGASLARSQGFKLLTEVRNNLQQGQIPADHLIEGLLLLIGAVLLVTPGLLTDLTGFLLVIPGSRRLAAKLAKAKIRHWLEKGSLNISYGEYRDYRAGGHSSTAGEEKPGQKNGPSIDVDFEDIRDK